MNLLSRLWLLLVSFLTLGVDPDDDPAPDADAGGATLDELIDDEDDLDPDGGEEEQNAGGEGDDAPPKPKVSKREKELQNELEQERAKTRDLQARQPAPTAQRDPDFDREEQEIAAARAGGATEEQLRWQKWAIDQQRALRETRRTSTAALTQAQDIADKTKFDRLEITKPNLYKRYAPKVEAALADFHAKGMYPSRELVMYMMLGKDAADGKVAPKAKPKAAAGDAGVARGRSPTTRSDTRGKAGASEREKRRARLENQII